MPTSSFPPDFWPEPFKHWWRVLRYRPLLWFALAALTGVALGGWWARWILAVQREDVLLWAPLLPLPVMVLVGTFLTGDLSRRWMACGVLVCLFATLTSRSSVPAAGDIAFLVRPEQALNGPYQPQIAEVQGVVVDYPQRSDFNIQFPLECRPPHSGRLWVRVPYGTKIKIGDTLRAQMQLRQHPESGNPAERVRSWNYVGQRCWAAGRVLEAEDIRSIRPSGRFGPQRRIAQVRQRLLNHFENAFTSRPFSGLTAQLMTAIVFGEGGLSEPLPRAVRDDFRAAGLSHVLVASGTQVSIMVGALLLAARGVGMRRWPLLVFLIPAVVGYAMLAGGAASIWRAAAVGILVAVAGLLGRQSDGLSLWSAALLGLLMIDPLQAWDIGFQLTFAATWGLIVLAPALKRALTSAFEPSFLLEAVALTLGAQLATVPLTLYHFGTLSVVGIGVNILAVPLAALLLFLGLAGLVVPPVNGLSYFAMNGLSWLAHTAGAQSGAAWEGSPVSLTTVIVLACVGLLGFTPSPQDWALLRQMALEKFVKGRARLTQRLLWVWHPVRGPVCLSGVLLILLWQARGPGDGQIHVTLLDVGQGEAILLQGPNGGTALIDGGTLEAGGRSDVGRAVIVPELRRRGIHRLDLMVLTHADADHVSGLTSVAREVPVGTFLDGPAATRSTPDPAAQDYLNLRAELQRQGVRFVTPVAGQYFDFGGARLTVLAPSGAVLPGDNNNAVVAMLEWGKSRVLLTGDIEESAEARLVRQQPDLNCTVLKVAHHGSGTSSTSALLDASRPKLALISCGKYNPFGHPKKSILERLQARGVATYRTDTHGQIEVTCDTETCGVQTYR